MTAKTEGVRAAFLCLGVMGYPMAGHLQRRGFAVTVWNRHAEKARKWADEYGGQCAPTPREAVRDADFVLVCSGDDPDVRAVLEGPDGALAGMRKGAVLIDHTTDSAVLARSLDAQCRSRGFGFLDAPVSGGQSGAENGKLSIMVGGEAETLEKARPVLEAYAVAVNHMGPAGSGQLTKMCNQIATVGIVQAVSEALAFGMNAGLDMDRVIAVLSKGVAGGWQLDNRGPTMVRGQFGFGFAVHWARKDLAIALAEARRNGSVLPVTSQIDQFYGQIESRGGGRWDTSSLITLLPRREPRE